MLSWFQPSWRPLGLFCFCDLKLNAKFHLPRFLLNFPPRKLYGLGKPNELNKTINHPKKNFFWGGGGKSFCKTKILAKIFIWQNFFLENLFFRQFFFIKDLLGGFFFRQNFWGVKNFFSPIFFLAKHFFFRDFFLLRNIYSFWKNFIAKKNCRQKIFLVNFFGNNFFWKQFF